MSLKEIEKRRQQLINLVSKYGLNSTKVIQVSRELDALLAQYQAQQISMSRTLSPKKIS
jgi:DNA repair ATPase RecN